MQKKMGVSLGVYMYGDCKLLAITLQTIVRMNHIECVACTSSIDRLAVFVLPQA